MSVSWIRFIISLPYSLIKGYISFMLFLLNLALRHFMVKEPETFVTKYELRRRESLENVVFELVTAIKSGMDFPNENFALPPLKQLEINEEITFKLDHPWINLSIALNNLKIYGSATLNTIHLKFNPLDKLNFLVHWVIQDLKIIGKINYKGRWLLLIPFKHSDSFTVKLKNITIIIRAKLLSDNPVTGFDYLDINIDLANKEGDFDAIGLLPRVLEKMFGEYINEYGVTVFNLLYPTFKDEVANIIKLKLTESISKASHRSM